ncbi:MAG TPA: cytochrome c biogenesis heme-transporting ATPase CcmA [Thioalkalivibrio sp.]|nr:cytochrome c biogenesis heme-transporting ATPase CcmA [Thioalkalivibrio sp.]
MPPQALSDECLRAVDLAAERGDRRLFQHLGFTLAPGQLLQVQGANGSGKTSLLRILCGLSRPARGAVYWGEEPLARVEGGIGSCLSYLGHRDALKDELSVRENVLFAARLGGMIAGREAADAVLARLGLTGYEDLPAGILSQGQKRRVALARLLLEARPLWVLDEPLAALDAQASAILREALAAQLAGGGMVILTTHQAVDVPGDCTCLRLPDGIEVATAC